MDQTVSNAQKLRLRRFAMAVTTYALVTFASFLTQQIGLGKMSLFQWAVFILLALLGNCFFLCLFLTNKNLRFKDPSLTKEQMIFSAIWGLWAVYHLPMARPLVIMFYVPAFCFGILRLNKREYFLVTSTVMAMYGAILVIECLTGRPGFNWKYEIFVFVLFGILFWWLAFFGGYVSELRRRLRNQNLEVQKANEDKDRLLRELQEALANVKTLKGLIPICAWCKKIRDDKGYWQQLEAYLRDHSDAEVSHGICPECAEKMSSEISGNVSRRSGK